MIHLIDLLTIPRCSSIKKVQKKSKTFISKTLPREEEDTGKTHLDTPQRRIGLKTNKEEFFYFFLLGWKKIFWKKLKAHLCEEKKESEIRESAAIYAARRHK